MDNKQTSEEIWRIVARA